MSVISAALSISDISYFLGTYGVTRMMTVAGGYILKDTVQYSALP